MTVKRPYNTKLIPLFFLLIVIFSSCLSNKDIAYFQDKEETYPPSREKENYESVKYEPIIQSNDILSIYVSSLSPEASSFFNTTFTKTESSNSGGGVNSTAVGYLVDVKGNIEMPLVGKIKVGGMTTSQATEDIKKKLEKFLLSPSVRIYFENYRVTVLGEVRLPGVYKVPNEKMTLPEVIGLAGDLTIFGKRDNIMIIREEDGKKTFAKLDLRSKDIFSSPYFYLHPNDVVYVEPNKGKTASADNFYRITPLIVSTITLLTVLAFRIFN